MGDSADQHNPTAHNQPNDADRAMNQNGHQIRSEPAKSATTLLNTGPTKTPTLATEVLRADAGDVQATTVTMERSGAETIAAERLTMSYSGAREIEARSAQLNASGVVSLDADYAVLHDSAAVSVNAREVRVVKGRAALVRAQSATIDAGARILIYAGRPDATIRPTLDTTGAFAAGAGFGLVVLLVGSFFRRLLR